MNESKPAPDPATGGAERRRFPRFAFTADAMMAIMIPEQTFTPLGIRSTVSDISRTGLRVKTYQLGKKDYLELLRSVHYAKIAFDLPGVEESIEAKTSIVWVEYHDRTASDQAHCILGMTFERFVGKSAELLEQGLRNLQATAIEAPKGTPLK